MSPLIGQFKLFLNFEQVVIMKSNVSLSTYENKQSNIPHDAKSIKALSDIKVATVMRRDRSMLAVLCGLLCASYFSLFKLNDSVGWAVLSVVAGAVMLWFGLTASAAQQSIKKSAFLLGDDTPQKDREK